MAFDIQKLETAHAGKGKKLWTYDGLADNKAAAQGGGFFNDAANLFSVSDRIMIASSDADFDAHVVSISGAGVVVIAAVDAF